MNPTSVYYVKSGERVSGPFTENQIASMVNHGSIHKTDRIGKDNSSRWVPFAAFAGGSVLGWIANELAKADPDSESKLESSSGGKSDGLFENLKDYQAVKTLNSPQASTISKYIAWKQLSLNKKTSPTDQQAKSNLARDENSESQAAKFDTVLIDSNSDNVFESALIDSNHDGKIDAILIDSNGDQKIDIIGLSTPPSANRNEYPSESRQLNPSPTKSPIISSNKFLEEESSAVKNELIDSELEVVEDDLDNAELEVIEDNLDNTELEVIENEPPPISNTIPSPVNSEEPMDCGIEERNTDQQNYVEDFDPQLEDEDSTGIFD